MNFNKDEERVHFSIYKRLFLPNGIIFVVSFVKEYEDTAMLAGTQIYLLKMQKHGVQSCPVNPLLL